MTTASRTTPMTPTGGDRGLPTFTVPSFEVSPNLVQRSPGCLTSPPSASSLRLPGSSQGQSPTGAGLAQKARSRNRGPGQALTCRPPHPRTHATSPPSRVSEPCDLDEGSKGSYLVTGQRERQLEGIIQKMRSEMEKYKKTTEQNATAWKTMQTELKSSAGRYMAEAQLYKADLDKIRQQLVTKERDCRDLKSTLQQQSDALSDAVKQLVDCKTAIKGFANFHLTSLKAMKNPETADKSLLVELKRIISETDEFSRLFNLPNMEQSIDAIVVQHHASDQQLSRASLSPSLALEKKTHYIDEIKELKDTNAILLEHILDLERAVGEIETTKAIRDTDLCWGIKEILSLCKEKEQLQNMHTQLKAKYDAYLRRPIQPAKISKLAQILAYLPKRRRKFVIQQESIVVELREEINRLKREMQRRDEEAKRRYDELLKRYNELWRRWNDLMDENARLRQENAELRRRIEELLGLLRLKDEQIEALKKDLELARLQMEQMRRQIDRLDSELKNKDLQFAEKMRELKQLFEAMRAEKEEKQREIAQLKERCSALERQIAELRGMLEKANRTIKDSEEDNGRLRDQLEKYLGTDSFDGLRALISLANMILARTKRPPPLSARDKQLIKDLFDVNTRGILDEIARLQDETKLYREELRKQMAQRETFANMLKATASKVSRTHDQY